MSLKIPVSAADHSQGAADAPVTLVEYGDYECPYCGLAYPIVKKLQSRFGAKLRFVFRNFPLTQMHAEALPAAMTAEFAGGHGKFWELHDALYENQDRLGDALYTELVAAVGLQAADLRAALASEALQQHVAKDFNGGVRSGVNGTPSFFINGSRHDGALTLHGLAEAISRQLG